MEDALPCFLSLSNSAAHTSSEMRTVSPPPCSYPQDCCDLSTALDPAAHVYPHTILFSIGPDSCGSFSQDTDSLLPSSDPECLTGLHTAREKLVPLSLLRSKDATQDLGESNKQPWPLLADSEEDM